MEQHSIILPKADIVILLASWLYNWPPDNTFITQDSFGQRHGIRFMGSQTVVQIDRIRHR